MIHAASTALAEAVLRLRATLPGGTDLQERLVRTPPSQSARIWIHAASVGELTSARQIIEALAQEFSVIVTTNSTTGRDMAAGWGLPTRLAPLDLPRALTRFLDAVQPRLALTVEQELWPLRSRILARRGIAQAVIGARMSERSARKWARFGRIITPTLRRLDAVSAQDPESERRLRQLGLPETAVLPVMDLKLLGPASVQPPEPDPDRARVILAASTHEGEDAVILDAWLAARAERPDLALILAPRHPRRGDAIAAMMHQRGIAFERRSQGGEAATVLLADTLGEMPRWYARAGICLVGGSLVDRGGHTPWEPAAYCCAILHGSFVSNHQQAYRALTDAGAARQVGPGDLADHLIRLVSDPPAALGMGQSAREVLDRRAGDPQILIARLRDLAMRGR